MSEISLTIIKPDAVKNGYTGAIIDKIIKDGFNIKAMKLISLTPEKAGKFYEIHKERPFYNELVKFMISGPVIPILLEKNNAVADFRKLIGATDPSKAEKGTIRNLYAESLQANAIHGSDSDENAQIEASFFFSEMEKI